MYISFIVAASENNVIGRKGDIPWEQKADLQFLRDKTRGHPIIMGRKTHEAIGKVLPNKHNIVITHRPESVLPGADAVSSIEEAIELAKKDGSDEVFIYGGGEIYKLAYPYTDRIYLTRIHATVEGDAFFPEFPLEKEWEKTRDERHEADTENQYAYTFLKYERVKGLKG